MGRVDMKLLNLKSIFFASKKYIKWVNVYRDLLTDITSFDWIFFSNQKDAEEIGKCHPCYVATAKVEWEE